MLELLLYCIIFANIICDGACVIRFMYVLFNYIFPLTFITSFLCICYLTSINSSISKQRRVKGFCNSNILNIFFLSLSFFFFLHLFVLFFNMTTHCFLRFLLGHLCVNIAWCVHNVDHLGYLRNFMYKFTGFLYRWYKKYYLLYFFSSDFQSFSTLYITSDLYTSM